MSALYSASKALAKGARTQALAMTNTAHDDDPPQPHGAAPAAFTAVLRPYRSLSPSGFLLLMALVSAVSFVAGLAFFLMGAWPVVGFFGFDVALVYAAFRVNYRGARVQERIVLSEGLLRVERFLRRGEVRSLDLNPYWVRVRLDENPDGSNELALVSHGKRVVIASCLGAGEKTRFAAALNAALARHKA